MLEGGRAPQGRVSAHGMQATSRKRPLGCGCCCDHHCGPDMVKKMPQTLPLSYALSVDPPEVLLTCCDPPRWGIENRNGTHFSEAVILGCRTESPGAMRCHLLGEGITQEGALRSQAQLSLPPWGHLGPNSNVNNKNSSSQLFPRDSLGYK